MGYKTLKTFGGKCPRKLLGRKAVTARRTPLGPARVGWKPSTTPEDVLGNVFLAQPARAASFEERGLKA